MPYVHYSMKREKMVLDYEIFINLFLCVANNFVHFFKKRFMMCTGSYQIFNILSNKFVLTGKQIDTGTLF